MGNKDRERQQKRNRKLFRKKKFFVEWNWMSMEEEDLNVAHSQYGANRIGRWEVN